MNGEQAERWAEKLLLQKNLTLLERNYRSHFGEIDLIMQDGNTLVFVEVRQRSNTDFGGPAASIDNHKQHRLILTARHYLAKHGPVPPCRFDAVLMDNAEGLNAEWIKNAFDA
ncbi:MAG: YraN family protein [Gallionella sp.]|jgi:putative endonuclease